MNAIFKYVGQGDSIILEWKDDFDNLHIGLIDCNKNGNSNPILDYLKANQPFSFEFIILSHPHDDHFSGLLEVLEFMETKKIKLSYFLHTCASKREYLQASVRTIVHTNLLISIFRKVNELEDSQLILQSGPVNNLTQSFALSPNVELKFWGPTQSSLGKYNQRAFRNDILSKNNPDANWLSTIIEVSSEDWMIVFTADAPNDAFWDLLRKGRLVSKPPLIIGQIPHHGSKDNFFGSFWRVIPKVAKPYGCISVGDNTYGHPSSDVVAELSSDFLSS
jgi:beta-lactamase superfamily II metal-dependent hydrolase